MIHYEQGQLMVHETLNHQSPLSINDVKRRADVTIRLCARSDYM